MSRRWAWLLGLPALVLVALPLLGLLRSLTAAPLTALWDDGVEAAPLLSSLKVLGWSLLWALPPGLLVGLRVARPGRGPRFWAWLALGLPLAVPSWVIASAWLDLFATVERATGWTLPSTGAWLAGLACATARWPLIAACTAARVAGQPRELLESARLVGGRGAERRLLLRLAAPGLVLGATLFAVLTTLDHFTPELCGLRTSALVFFEAMQRYREPLMAVRAALPISLGLLVLALVLGASTRSAVWPGRRRAAGPEGQRWAALLVCVLVGLGPPLGQLLYRASGFGELLQVFAASLRNSLLLSGACVGVCWLAGFGSVLGGASGRWGRRLDRLVGIVALVAFVTPGPLLAIGSLHIHAGNALVRSPWLLILSLAASQLWLARELLRVGLAGVEPRSLEAARLAGASWPAIGLRLLLVPLRPWFVGAALLIGWFCFYDIASTALLQPPGWQPFAVQLGNRLHYGNETFAAAASLLGVVLDLGLLLVLPWLAGLRRAETR